MPDNQDATPSYLEEIEAALSDDTTQIGIVFRDMREDENKSAQSIAEALGLGTSPVYGSLSSIETLRKGNIVVGTAKYAATKARMLRGFYKRHEHNLSDATKQRLVALADEHETFANANREEENIRENEKNERALESDGKLDVPGIYVYTYPHYYNSPVQPSEDGDDNKDRTYLKIGVTESSLGASKRIQQQIGEVRTALPELPLILRIYNGDNVDLTKTEKQIQRHLDAADHNPINKQRRSGVGTEWFLTHLKFLDSTADLLGLEAKYRRPDEDDE